MSKWKNRSCNELRELLTRVQPLSLFYIDAITADSTSVTDATTYNHSINLSYTDAITADSTSVTDATTFDDNDNKNIDDNDNSSNIIILHNDVNISLKHQHYI